MILSVAENHGLYFHEPTAVPTAREETTMTTTDPAVYEMYTDDGNKFVAEMVDGFIDAGLAGGFTRNELDDEIRHLITTIAAVHGEVRDTEPEWAICDAVNLRLCDQQGWTHTSREDW